MEYSENLNSVPVLLLTFKRPDLTLKVIDSLRAVKPKQVFVACDGARLDHSTEIEKNKKVKELIEVSIDWNCEVKKLYQTENLGCGKAVSTAITWFFDNVPEGIILEDDTIPNAAFFSFAKEMLLKYRNNKKVMHISGINFKGKEARKSSYYFSKYSHIWGWATWRRAWKGYDFNMQKWPLVKDSNEFKIWCSSKVEKDYWFKVFEAVYKKQIDTWDYQWLFTILSCNGLCINPSVNMVKNIGFNEDATHTKIADQRFSNKPVFNLNEYETFDIELLSEKEADEVTFNSVYNSNNQNKKDRKATILKKMILNRMINYSKRT